MDYATAITATATAIGKIADASGEWAKFLCSAAGQKLVNAMVNNDSAFRSAMADGWTKAGADVKGVFENLKSLFNQVNQVNQVQ